LECVRRNDRRRVSFVFRGDNGRVREHREAYRRGPVRLDMRCFRESLIHMWRLMDGAREQRSAPCPPKSRPPMAVSSTR
jgi:hypothetical protein